MTKPLEPTWRGFVNKGQQDEAPTTSEKRTVELCADELHKGARCILDRGHGGDHEYLSPPFVTGAVSWKPNAS
jgi:hypothetical protein